LKILEKVFVIIDMIKLLFLFLIFMNTEVFSQEKPVSREAFGYAYFEAVSYINQNRAQISGVFISKNVNPDILIPVVFPERLRYSGFSNYFETKSLEFLYTEFGSESVDFSIGPFQMKPSFAEAVEFEITNRPALREKYSELKIRETDIVQEREERIRRLNLLYFQALYIAAFSDLLNDRFNLSALSQIENIRFTAAAYNTGFTKNYAQISAAGRMHCFPHGANYTGVQYSYTDVSVFYFQNDYFYSK